MTARRCGDGSRWRLAATATRSRMIIFHVKGALLDRRLIWPGSDEITRQGLVADIAGAGVPLSRVEEPLVLCGSISQNSTERARGSSNRARPGWGAPPRRSGRRGAGARLSGEAEMNPLMQQLLREHEYLRERLRTEFSDIDDETCGTRWKG